MHKNFIPQILFLLLYTGASFAQQSEGAVYYEDFEDKIPNSYYIPNELHINSDPAPGGGPEITIRQNGGVNNSQCLLLTHLPFHKGTHRVRYRMPIPHNKEYTVNYDIFFEDGFEWVLGGKLPGLSPAIYSIGCTDIKPDRWSVRLMWRKEGRLVEYLYHQNRESTCGDDIESGFFFETGRWYTISIHTRVNDPVSASNGFVDLYVDGNLVASKDSLKHRSVDTPESEICYFFFSTLHGGHEQKHATSKTVYSRYDNIEVFPGKNIRKN